eukprot:COSAG02_NODE_153_length_33128_cov_10.471253_1_plen_225_part_10
MESAVTPMKSTTLVPLGKEQPEAPLSPPDDAPESPGAPDLRSARTSVGEADVLAASAGSPAAGQVCIHAPASPVSASPSSRPLVQGVSDAVLALPSAELGSPATPPPPQNWGTTAARREGTARVAADDVGIETIYWTGRHGSTRGTEDEVVALARALCSNTRVQQVSIRHSPEAVTMGSMSAMLSALKKCPMLVSLDMGMESTTPHQRKVIRTACVVNACQRLAA